MWQIVGHEPAVELLDRLVTSGQVPQAVLLTGPVSVGKATLALEVAKALNCLGDVPPCGKCRECRQIDAGTHPDIAVIESADGKDSIAIGQVRELRDVASLRPFQGRRKVYVITGAEALTAQAADALLKTLEEPQPQVVILLTASDADGLPDTVVSRCRTIGLRPLTEQQIRAALLSRGASDDDAVRLARLARGSVGWALQALKTPKMAAQQEEIVERLSHVLDLSRSERLDLAEAIAGERKDRAAIRRNLETLTLLMRDALFAAYGLQPLLASETAAERMRQQGERLGLPGMARAFESARIAMHRIDGNVDPRLALEAMMLALP